MEEIDFLTVLATLYKRNLNADTILSDAQKAERKAGVEALQALARSYARRKKPIVSVVAALIWDGDRFLICQRPVDKARGLLWEFAGGKVEPGETKEQALVRECREELDITLQVGPVFMEIVHEYPDLTVLLTLFHASIADGVPRLLEHNALRWITVGQIHNYAFCQADEEILEKIKRDLGPELLARQSARHRRSTFSRF